MLLPFFFYYSAESKNRQQKSAPPGRKTNDDPFQPGHCRATHPEGMRVEPATVSYCPRGLPRNVKWPLTTCFLPSKQFCVVKGHFAEFLVSNILVTSAFCRLTTSNDFLLFTCFLISTQFISLKRDDLISRKDLDRSNRLRLLPNRSLTSDFFFFALNICLRFWFFCFLTFASGFSFCYSFKRMLMFLAWNLFPFAFVLRFIPFAYAFVLLWNSILYFYASKNLKCNWFGTCVRRFLCISISSFDSE